MKNGNRKRTTVFFFIVALAFGLGCKNHKTMEVSGSEEMEWENYLLKNYDLRDVYEELVRRSLIERNDVSSDTLLSMASEVDFNDSTKSLVDTIKNENLQDTIMPFMVKSNLAQMSTEFLIKFYNATVKKRQENKGIYQWDDRKEVDHGLEPNYISSSACVFALIERRFLNRQTSTLRSKGKYGILYELCDKERFLSQECFANCTAFAVGSNIVVSAGHCIDEANFKDYYLIGGLTNDNIIKYKSIGIPAEEVFEIVRVQKSRNVGEQDYSIFVINKHLPINRIAKLSKRNTYNEDDNFYVLGFPAGLSMKLCNSSSFRRDISDNFFVINADTYGGNSGSPVFNEETNEVEGILVRGNVDFFVSKNGCRESVICPEFGCRGEDVTKIRLVRAALSQ